MRVFKSRLFWGSLIASLLVHAGILIFLYASPRLLPEKKETIEIALYPEGQILEALTRNKQSIVKEALAPEKLKAPEDETLARFLSKEKQRVRQEVKAAITGSTANRTNSAPAAPTPPAPPQARKDSAKNNEPGDDGFKNVDISKDLQEMNRFGEGFSTVGENLPNDIRIGSFTALNTDRYLYYTFYARIEELIRYRWETRVQHAINNFDRPTLAALSNRNWTTQVEFLLDSKGELKKALLMKESGVKAFDASAINAFQDARIFPNPPQEMIQEDGFIHIKFSFTVNYHPPALVNRY